MPLRDGRILPLRGWAVLVLLIAGVLAVQSTRWMFVASGRSLFSPRTKMTTSGNTAGSDAVRVPVLAELFTSEGCSSCPPADAVLMNLLETQPVSGVEIIGLSEHVDYWDRLGWRDPFSSADFSARQSDYAARVFHTGTIYTPQLVIGGSEQLVGSDSAAIVKAIARAAQPPLAIVVIATPDGTSVPGSGSSAVITASLVDKRTGAADFEVMAAIAEDGLKSEVRRGENAGRQLDHSAVVRRLTRIGVLSEQAPALSLEWPLTLDPAWTYDHLRVVVFVQNRTTRAVLGASMLSLRR